MKTVLKLCNCNHFTHNLLVTISLYSLSIAESRIKSNFAKRFKQKMKGMEQSFPKWLSI